MDNAEVYLVLLRPSTVPVLGEAQAMGFQGQVELKAWTWNLHNEEERKNAEAAQKKYAKKESKLLRRKSAGLRLDRASMELNKSLNKAQEDFDKSLSKLGHDLSNRIGNADQDVDKMRDELQQGFDKERDRLKRSFQRQEAKLKQIKLEKNDEEWQEKEAKLESKAWEQAFEEAERNRNFEFTFSKRVDLASTQMLNSMKVGDVFPTATLTIFQRSSNSGMGLVFNLLKVRLLDYALKVEVSDTMTDMMEEWTAEFEALSYVYKNRAATGESTGMTQAAVKSGSQGTVRTFAMKRTLKALRSL
jgi:type VI protein secretion system component Hcp